VRCRDDDARSDFLVGTLTYLLGAVPGLNVAEFVVTAIVSYPILMAMVTPEPPR